MTENNGRKDVIGVLREQHQIVRDLMASVKTSLPGSRVDSFEPLVRLLAVHETAEEMVVYPALRGSAGDEGARIVEARKLEEDEAKKVLSNLESLDPASAEFLTMFTSFSEAVEEHASAEEREVFPLLERTMDGDVRRGLAVQLQIAEGIAPTHPHKFAPESAIGNLLVGPYVSMIDRVRDLFHDAGRR
jgi:hemerythrin superfamily protein